MKTKAVDKKGKIQHRLGRVDPKTPLTRRFSNCGGHKRRSAISTSFQIGGNR